MLRAYSGSPPNWRSAAGLGPQIGHKTRTTGLHGAHELHKQLLAVGIFVGGEVLPVQLGTDRVHHHARVHVVDPDVFVAAVAQRPDGRRSALARLVVGHGALLAEAVEMRGNAVGRFDHLAHAGLALLQDQLPLGHQKPCGHDDDAENGAQHQKGQFLCDGHGRLF